MKYLRELNSKSNIYVADYKCYNEKCTSLMEYIFTKWEKKLTTNINDAKFIVCVGGDGTLIKTVHHYLSYNLPIIGINAGTVGFMMNSSNLDEVDSIFQDDFKPYIIPLQLMKVNIQDEYFYAFNEVMIGGDMSSWINFEVENSHELHGSVKGGGLIFSTAQGSTGINKNNGGPILPLESNLWSITGDKTDTKIKHVVTPHEIVVNATSRNDITFWCDGHEKHILGNKMKIIINDSYKTVNIGFTYPERFLIKRRNSK